MDVVLLTLTTISLVAAAAFGALAWRVGREERERARARITALSTAMNPPAPLRGYGEAGSPSSLRGFREAGSLSPLRGFGDSMPDSAIPVDTRVAVGSVFERAAEGLRGRPAIKLAVGVLMALAIVIAGIVGARGGDATPAAAPAPLELMSMRYQRQGTTLTVAGLVRNPKAGASLNGVTAVVYAFDRAGAFVASGRAPLDLGALRPGDESPFTVSVANVGDVARYRVTFRSGDTIVRHVDRRSNQVQLAVR